MAAVPLGKHPGEREAGLVADGEPAVGLCAGASASRSLSQALYSAFSRETQCPCPPGPPPHLWSSGAFPRRLTVSLTLCFGVGCSPPAWVAVPGPLSVPPLNWKLSAATRTQPCSYPYLAHLRQATNVCDALEFGTSDQGRSGTCARREFQAVERRGVWVLEMEGHSKDMGVAGE